MADGLSAFAGGLSKVSPLGAGIASLPSLYSMIAGGVQRRRAAELYKSLKRPYYNPEAYTIPGEAGEYLNMTKDRILNPNLPGQGLMEDKLGAVTASSVDRTTDPNQVADIYKNQMSAQNDLNIKAAENYMNQKTAKESDVATALQYMKGAKDTFYDKNLDRYNKMFGYNQDEPYKEKAAAISSLIYGANQNVYSGLNGLSSIGSALTMFGNPANRNKPGFVGGRATADNGGYYA